MLIRYPGTKGKLFSQLCRHIPDEIQCEIVSCTASDVEYREPFFGSGEIGWRIMDHISRKASVWLNDLDRDLIALWESVRDHADDLLRKVHKFEPTAERFYEFKGSDGDGNGHVVDRGFRKLALHMLSYSGLGAKSGGPLGGRHQKNDKYNASCRWNPEKLRKDIDRLSKRMRRFASVRLTCGDFEPCIATAPATAFVYCDPPYYRKGPELYKHSMSECDHERLAGALRSSVCGWMLSYDDCREIRNLYSWATFHEVQSTYTIARASTGNRPKNREVVIVP